jgi:hypothetical protein
MCIQVTNPLLLFRRLKINQKYHGSFAFILEKGAVGNTRESRLAGVYIAGKFFHKFVR